MKIISIKKSKQGYKDTARQARTVRYGWTFASFLMVGVMLLTGLYAFGSITNTRAVSFYLNGELYDTASVRNGTMVNMPEPLEYGQTFVGWYLDEGFEQPFNGTVTQNVSLHARFTKNTYSVTMVDPKNLSEPQVKQYQFGQTFLLSEFDKPEGAIGYHTIQHGLTILNEEQDMLSQLKRSDEPDVAQNITVYARYDATIPAADATNPETVIVRYQFDQISDRIYVMSSALSRFNGFTDIITSTDKLFYPEHLVGIYPINNGLTYYGFNRWTLPNGDTFRDGEAINLDTVISDPQNFTYFIPSSNHYYTSFSSITKIKVITLTATWTGITF